MAIYTDIPQATLSYKKQGFLQQNLILTECSKEQKNIFQRNGTYFKNETILARIATSTEDIRRRTNDDKKIPGRSEIKTLPKDNIHEGP